MGQKKTTIEVSKEEGLVIVASMALGLLMEKNGTIKLKKEIGLTTNEIKFLLVRIVQELELEKDYPEMAEAYKLIAKENEVVN